jgi:hypothetical protein
MRRLPWLIVLILGVAVVYLGAGLQEAKHRAARAERLSVQSPYQRVLMDDMELAQLRKLGLADPVPAIKSDLAKQGKLLPYSGVLGGTMAFYDRDAMVLLPGQYVYAEADDGHYLVHALLRYAVQPGGKIQWKIVDAHRD